MRNDDLIRIRHMRDAAREALGFAAGKNRCDLETDRICCFLWSTVTLELPALLPQLETLISGND